MHTNYDQIVKLLKSFKIIIVAPTCFGLHKTPSGSSQPVLRQSYNVDFDYTSLFEVIGMCNRSQHCNFGEAQAESSLMVVYVNRNMLEQLL